MKKSVSEIGREFDANQASILMGILNGSRARTQLDMVFIFADTTYGTDFWFRQMKREGGFTHGAREWLRDCLLAYVKGV